MGLTKHDDRPAKGSWAPGGYTCKCWVCDCCFIGDKWATKCADCAYAEPAGAYTVRAPSPTPSSDRAAGVTERDDREVEDIERLASSRGVLHWGGILRIIARMRAAEAALAAVPPHQSGGWRPIKTAPKDGTMVLAWDGKSILTAYWSRSHPLAPPTWIGGHCRVNHIDQPTHYQPLPAPPSDHLPARQEGDQING